MPDLTRKNIHINRNIPFIILTIAVLSLGSVQISYKKDKSILTNSWLKIAFNIQTGSFNVERATGQPLISGAICGMHSENESRITTAPDFSYDVRKLPANNDIGNGRMLKINGHDKKKMLDIEIRISTYDSLQAVIFEMTCKNVSQNDIVINSIEPLRVIKEESGSLFYPCVKKCLTNGAMYYDAGTIHEFGTPYIKPEPYGETKGGVIKNNALSVHEETVQSWWNVGLFSGYHQEGMSLGYIENRNSLGRIQILKTDTNQLSFVAESIFNPGFRLQPGESISSDRFLIILAEDPYKSLECYASIIKKVNQGCTGSVINGWCNWFYTLNQFDENEIIRNTEFAARYLKSYGLEYIQIDEGYQTMHGEWQGNERFPHGLKWLADTIKSFGLKPGIWISPFVVSDTTNIFKQHPEWFMKNEDGSLKRIGPWPNEDTDWFRNEVPKRYGLDITHPGAEKWFTDLIDTIVNSWGFEMIKIDFVAWTVFSAHHFYDPSYTPAQVYRKAFEIIRKVAGDRCHLLDCGPGNITAGLINSMRIEYDQNYGYRNDSWKQYFIGPSSSAGAAGKRYYYHNTSWINDADHVCIDLLSPQQSQAAASLIALTGGNTMSGDRLITMDAGKLEIFRKILPSSGLNGKPVDLWDSEIQTVFTVNVMKKFGEWTVAGFFNPDLHQNAVKEFSLERLWLDPDKTYLCYDFWKEQFFGEITDKIHVEIDPGSVTLLSFHEKKDFPQIISTTRHVLQGAVEIEDSWFDHSSASLHGISHGPQGTTHNVIIYVPYGYYWLPVQNILYDDFENYSVKMVDTNILRIKLNFDNTTTISWKIPFEKVN